MTKAKDQRPKTERYIWLFFAVIIIFIYFFGLTVPLLGPDEPRYSQIAREMFERGDPITPKLGNFDWFEKPALLYWLQIASYKIFGVSEFSARFGSAIFGLGTVLSLWILGKWVQSPKSKVQSQENDLAANNEQRTTNNFANWLALIAASSIGLLVFSRGASFDIILTFPITASLVAFFIFDQKSNKKSGFTFYLLPFTFYLFIGISLIAKGLIGAVFPFAIAAFYYLLSWKLPSKIFIVSLIWGTILITLVASVWYLPMYLENGWKFIDEFFIQHHFQRYVSDKYQHPQPFWFFWLVLPLMTIPWLPFFFASIWDFFKVQSPSTLQSPKSEVQSRKTVPRFRVSASPLRLFAFAWLLVPLVFFSVSGSKLPGYILPALPAALILTAEYVYKFVQKSERHKIGVQILAFLTFAVVAILLQFVVPKFAYADSTKGLMQAANERGLTTEKVLNLHTISHNAEFYAAGRLIRTDDGKLKKFLGVSEIVEQIKRGNDKRVLVLVPHEYLNELTTSDLVEAEVLEKNGELAIVSVKNK